MRRRLPPLCLALFVLSAAISGGCGGGRSTSSTTTATGSTTVSTNTTGETGESASPPGAFTVKGRGPATRVINLPSDYRPVVILARYPPRSLLSVQLRGNGFERSRGESGELQFSGSPLSFDAEPSIASGRYKLSVTDVKGPWSLQFAVPKPDASAFPMFGEGIQGTHDQIGKVHLSTESELKWKMQSEAPLMSAKLVGYGDAQGTEQFLGMQGNNGVGFAPGSHGFRSDAPMPAGDYLLVVDADGRWVVTFSPAH